MPHDEQPTYEQWLETYTPMMGAETPPAAGGEGDGDGGGDDGGSVPWDLSDVPEALQPALTEQLKKVEGGITKRFQDHAQYRSQWEPYESIEGFSDLSPDQVSELVGFAQLAQDDDQFGEWLMGEAQARGLLGDDGGDGGSDDDLLDDGGPDQIKELIASALDERLGPLEAGFEQQSQMQREQAAGQEVQDSLSALHEEHGEFDDQIVCQLAIGYAEDGAGADAINKAFADYQNIVGQAEGGIFKSKANSPASAETGGKPDSAAKPITSLDEAREAALAMVRQTQQT